MPSNDKGQALSLTTQDFEAIREAVMETPRGRWFLNEFASRLRSSETVSMLDSMKRLETAVSASHDALMSRLAQALANEPAALSKPVPQTDLVPKHMKFFKQDEEIFEPAPQAQIAAVAPPPKPEAKPEIARGAKVVIRRAVENPAPVEAMEKAEAEPAPAVEAAAAQTELAAMPAEPPQPEPSPAPQAEAAPKRRIVIIRHKPGEDINVPMQNEMAEAS